MIVARSGPPPVGPGALLLLALAIVVISNSKK